jgi:hypothetical protein
MPKHRFRKQLSNVEIAYELAVSEHNQSDPRAEHLRDLEVKIASETGAAVTQNIGQRIAQLRHSVAHGNPIGADSEGRFYSLLVIMLTFGDPNWSPPTWMDESSTGIGNWPLATTSDRFSIVPNLPVDKSDRQRVQILYSGTIHASWVFRHSDHSILLGNTEDSPGGITAFDDGDYVQLAPYDGIEFFVFGRHWVLCVR